MKPICIPCQRFFRPKHTGFKFVEGMPVHDNTPPGTAEPNSWRPYKLWTGDKWKCEGCGAEIIVGFGHGPIAEHYQENFDELVTRYNAEFQVNDC